jgi:hypothetical protein
VTAMDAIEKRATVQRTPVDWRAVRLFVVAVVPLMLGYAVGAVVWVAVRVGAAFMQGFDAGAGRAATPTPTPRRQGG